MWPFTRKKAPESSSPPPALWDSSIEVILGRVRYSCATATILANRKGKGVCLSDYGEEYLCKTPMGNYFSVSWQSFGRGETHYYTIHPYTLEEAMHSYNHLPEQLCSFKEAFGIDIVDA